MKLDVTVPDGKSGPWSISTFEIDEEGAEHFNFLNVELKGRDRRLMVKPGTYKRLVHNERGIIMSNTPMEVVTNMAFINAARGEVLINGLGLGMVVEAILAKPEVTHVTVVELDPDVIKLTGTHLKAKYGGRLKIVNESAFDYTPAKGVRFGAAWHDIWDTICASNLPEMTKLMRKYGNKTDWQGCWAQDMCRALR